VLIVHVLKVFCFVALLQVLILKGVSAFRGREVKSAELSQTYPHPGCFAKRVWICLIAKGSTFLAATKSLQQYEMTVLVASGRAQNLKRCEDTVGWGKRRERNGDTVSRTLGWRIPYPLLFVKWEIKDWRLNGLRTSVWSKSKEGNKRNQSRPFPKIEGVGYPPKTKVKSPTLARINGARMGHPPYNVKKGGSSNFQSSAEACAKHLKNWRQHTGK
jgi:hypothetical protein